MKFAIWGSGGSGKTTLTAMLSTLLAPEKTLAIGGSLTHISLKNSFGLLDCSLSLARIFRNFSEWENNLSITGYQGLYVLDNSINENCLVNNGVGDSQAQEILNLASRDFDNWLVDCDTDFDNVLTRAALLNADRVLLVLKPELESLSFYLSHRILLEKMRIKSKTSVILNGHRRQVNIGVMEKMLNLQFATIVPFYPDMPLLALRGEIPEAVKNKQIRTALNNILLKGVGSDI